MKNILDQHRKDPIRDDVLPFLSSMEEDLWIIKEDVIGTMAHVIMLYEQSILSKTETRAILTELNEILSKIKKDELEIDNSFEDIHPYIESLVIDAIGIEIGGKIHSARSRNDQVALDIRLKIRYELIEVEYLLRDLIIILLKKAEESVDKVCPLYTHLQRGQIGVFGHYFMNYAHQLTRSMETIIHILKQVNQNPLGACAIGGSSFPINRERTTRLLAFEGIIINSIDAVSSRDYLLVTQMGLTLIADILTRIAEDFIIWSTKEFDYIELSDGFSSVSSAMPQKKNPDSMELMKGKMGRIYGGLTHLLFMSKGTPSGYVRDFQESKVPIAKSFLVLKQAIEVLSGALSTLTVKTERMRDAAESSLILALDLAEYLAKNTKLSFREGHNLVGGLIRDFKEKNKIFQAENIKLMSRKIFNKQIDVNQQELDELKNLDKTLKLRQSLGAPNPNDLTDDIENLKEKINNLTHKIKDYEHKFDAAEEEIINYKI